MVQQVEEGQEVMVRRNSNFSIQNWNRNYNGDWLVEGIASDDAVAPATNGANGNNGIVIVNNSIMTPQIEQLNNQIQQLNKKLILCLHLK